MHAQPVDNFFESNDLVDCVSTVATAATNTCDMSELAGPVRPRGRRQRGEPRRERRSRKGQTLDASYAPAQAQKSNSEAHDQTDNKQRRRRMARVADEVIAQLRGLALSKAFDRLGLYHSLDREYRPTKDTRSVRVLVTVDATVIELIITGKVWFDTRAAKGGRGCVDLAMHLLQLDFAQAVARLVVQGDTHQCDGGHQ